MENEEKAGAWKSLIEQREASGQTIKAFCAERGIPESRYYYWRKRLSDDSSEAGFIELTGQNCSVPLYELELGHVRLRIYQTVGLDYVASLAKNLLGI
jgi:hypothetical protein